MVTRAHWLAMLVFVLSLSNTARAGGKDDIEMARAHFAQGTRLYEVGEYRQALEEFKAAHLSKPDPAFLYNIGQCHRQLGDLEQAVVLYKRYLAASPGAANRADVEKRIAEMETELSARKRGEPKLPPSQVLPPAGPVPGVYAPSAVPTPTHGPGSSPEPVTPLPPPSPAVSPVAPPATTTPPVATPAATADANLTAPTPQSQPTPSSLRTLRWVGVGVTVALAAGAVVTGVLAQSKYDDLKKTCGETDAGCSSGEIDKVKSRALVTNVLWAATGVAALATGVMFIATPSQGAVQLAWRF